MKMVEVIAISPQGSRELVAQYEAGRGARTRLQHHMILVRQFPSCVAVGDWKKVAWLNDAH